MRLLLRLLAGASLLASTSAAWATSYTGTFSDTKTGAATETFNNFDGSLLNLTATCGSNGSDCKIESAAGLGGGDMSLGVYESGSTDGTIQATHFENVIFNFGTSVTLTGVELDLLNTGTNGYIIYACTTDTCASKTTILSSSGTGSNGGTDVSPTFTAATGQFFEIAANSSDHSTQFGINSLSFDTNSPVPEPPTLGVVGLALLSLGGLSLRRRART